MKKIDIYEVGPRDGFQMVDEYIPVESMQKAVEVIVKICELTASKPAESWASRASGTEN